MNHGSNIVPMLRNSKHYGRCRMHGHGNCEVSVENISNVITRTKEKVEIKKDINIEMDSFDDWEV